MSDAYERAFTVASCIDGDTIKVADVDLGYKVHEHGVQYRILGIDCPEIHGATKPAGLVAKAFTEAWLVEHTTHGGLFAQTTKTDNFGRYLAVVTCSLGHDLAADLLSSGNAVPYRAT